MFVEEIVKFVYASLFPQVIAAVTNRNIIIASGLCVLIYIFLRPMNRIREVDDVGWLSKNNQGRSRRRRKIGNLPPVYPNGWFVLAESSKVSNEEVLHVSALGENFAIFRTESGTVNVLDAYCPHMGANMGVGGKVRGDCLECPFHLWQFSGETGACTRAPTVDKVPKNAKVKKWISHECNDFIFVWYHAEGEPPGWYPPNIEELKNLSYHGRNEYQVNCHIQEIPENGSDFTHFAALHEANVLSGSDLRHHESKWPQLYRHCWKSSWEPGTQPEEQHIGRAFLNHHITFFGKISIGSCTIDVHQVGPGFVILFVKTTIGPVILLQSVTPTEPLLQTVIHRVYSPPYLYLYTKFFLYSECIMFERDVMIWNNKMFVDKPLFTKEDASIARYRRWFSQFYTEHSPTYQTAKEGMDW